MTQRAHHSSKAMVWLVVSLGISVMLIGYLTFQDIESAGLGEGDGASLRLGASSRFSSQNLDTRSKASSPSDSADVGTKSVGDNSLKLVSDQVERQDSRGPDLSLEASAQPVDGRVSSDTRRAMAGRSAQTAHAAQNQSKDLDYVADMVDRGDWQLAEQKLHAILADEPENERALVEMALIQLIERQKPSSAKTYLEKAVLVNPDNQHLVLELLAVYSETGELEAGLSFLKSVPADHRQSGSIDFAIGSALHQSGKTHEALSYFQTAVENSLPAETRAKEALVDVYIELGRYEEALDTLQSLAEHERSPNKIRSLKLQMVTAHVEKGSYTDATEILNELKEQNPSDPLIAQLLTDVSRRMM